VIEIVNDDMPFLVDSVSMEINRHGLALHLIIHPTVRVTRAPAADGEQEITALATADAATGARESLMHIEIDRVSDRTKLDALGADLARVLDDVRAAVDDWQPMLARLKGAAADLARDPPPLAAATVADARDFIEWLADSHFTLLGYRCHDLVVHEGGDALKLVPGSGLGVLREAEGELSGSFAALPQATRSYARVKDILIVTKSNARSTVHRPGYLDYVGVKRYDAKGEVCGEHRFIGLYTHTAYNASPETIPVLRRKVASVRQRAGLAPGGHAAKQLENILDTYPRDELLQIDEAVLFDQAMGILRLGTRQRFRLFVSRDRFERFVSCLIYAPRERYTTDLREKWQAILLKAYAGTSAEFSVSLTEAPLVRVLMTVRTTPGNIPEVDVGALERRLDEAARRWDDDLKAALIERLGEARANPLFAQFDHAFPAGYREDVPARNAVADVEMAARTLAEGSLGLQLYRPLEAAPGTLRFKLFRRGTPIAISDSLPMLERMGLRVLEERPYRVAVTGADPVWIHDFGLAAAGAAIEPEDVAPVFEDAFGHIFSGTVENDGFNRLVLGAKLAATQIVVLRAYAKYLRQIGFTLSQPFIEQTLAANPAIARMLVELFELRFDPEGDDGTAAKAKVAAIETALDAVENLSEDRVLRQYVALIQATVRTNAWRRDAAGARRSFLSFKLESAKVPGLPEPRPLFEIFVYSPRFEGIHLRAGKVARGGLRWSDRPEDFRTEVLGLVKAQVVKNTVIVPTGSKGGFVLKRAPAPSEREAYLAEGVACYKDFLRGLLDLTDNLVSDGIVPPPAVRRLDPDDPYLVVAADKGTATFSDYANGVSKEYGFWMGDAFASGGSVGYDHKAMGITARGAWESVKRHFREIGLDTQTTPFTVVGIGDMSGDVFGNGMLLSPHIKLVVAFDHRHIFIDPSPDPAASHAERARLFKLPRSSWADYEARLISKGGGVWPRSAKSVPLSPEARAVIGIAAEHLTPAELINAVLKASVDLLYNGGIGTYVKSAGETHAQVGDRANDAIRVNGSELRCKVVAEGGNLGCTQLGRIEYTQAGGKIYTDAIDNSAGVDTSDHEVNIKILLGLAVSDGELTEKQRNATLAKMTGDVAALVLRDNYFQTQAISLAGRVAPRLLDAQARFIAFLEKAGRLHRAIEFLPADDEIAVRRSRKAGLTSPECAVLLAYSKIWLSDEFVGSDLPEDAWIGTALNRYFPAALREQHGALMQRHPLKRDIIATHVVNSMVNRVGPTFVHQLLETTGARVAEIVRAYLLTREVFGFVPLWQKIEALDSKVADAVQAEMLLEGGRLVSRGTTWFLRSPRLAEPMAATIERFAPGVEALHPMIPQLLDAQGSAPLAEQGTRWEKAGVPADLARRVASLDTLFAALDVSDVAAQSGRPFATTAAVYFGVTARLGLPWLRGRIHGLPGDGHWQVLARNSLRDDLSALQRSLTRQALGDGGSDDAPALVAAWDSRNKVPLERVGRIMGELRAVPTPDVAMLSVALRELRNLA
jgi:glutamate dehydrogenase